MSAPTIPMQSVNVGASANDGTGDPLRTAFQKINGNAQQTLIINVSPEEFGAAGTFNMTSRTGQDDAPAWNAMLNYVRTKQTSVSLSGQSTQAHIFCRPGAVYRLNSPLNFTAFRSGPLFVYGNGCTFYIKDINDQAVFDCIWSIGLNFYDFVMLAENGGNSGSLVQPRYGIVLGRRDADDASEHVLRNVELQGWYNYANLYAIGSELVKLDHVHFEQAVDPSFVGNVMSGLAMHLTSTNEANYVSPFQIINNGALPSFGFGGWTIIQGAFQSQQGATMRIQGPTGEIKFYNCYGQSNTHEMLRLLNNHADMQLDIHVETATVPSSVLLDAQAANCQINGLTLIDGQPQSQFIFDSVGSMNRAIYNAEVLIPSTFAPNAALIKMFKPGSGINFQGKIKIGTETGMNDIGGANSFRGEIMTQLAATDANGPINHFAASGYAMVHSFIDNWPTFHPTHRLSPIGFSALPGSPVQGLIAAITDATVNTWGTNVTVGGGTNKVLVYYNGTNWTVFGK